MKRKELIKGLCRTLSIARIAKDKNVKQSEIIDLVKNKDKEINKIYSNYYDEFIKVFNQL